MKRSLFVTICLSLFIYISNISTSKASSQAKAVSELLQAGEYLVALNVLETIKKLVPCDPELLFLEARAYEDVGDTNNAMSIYESLINLAPDFPGSYNNLALLYAAQGNLKHAEALIFQGLATDTIYQTLYTNLNKLYVARAATFYGRALGFEQNESSEPNVALPLVLTDSKELHHNITPSDIPDSVTCN